MLDEGQYVFLRNAGLRQLRSARSVAIRQSLLSAEAAQEGRR